MLKRSLSLSFIILLPVIILVLSYQYVLSQTITIFAWAKSAGGNDFDTGADIAIDNANNVFVTGAFRDTAIFGSGTSAVTAVSMGNADMFIAKYNNNNGALQWIRSAGASNWDAGNAIAVDNSGNSVVTGMFQDTVIFGTGQSTTVLNSAGRDDIFIAKYDPNGQLLWAKQAGGSSFDQGQGIVTNQADEIFVTGSFFNTATFSSTQITSAGRRDIFVAKYTTDGKLVWIHQAGGIEDDEGLDITLDNLGNVIVTGYFETTATFSTTVLTSEGGADIFLAKYDSDGTFLWARQINGVYGLDSGYGVATGPSNDILVTGVFGFTATVKGGSITKTLISAGDEDIFITKFNTNGQLQWAKQAGGTNSFDRGYDIVVDQAGSSCIVGVFQGTAIFDSTRLTSAGSIDMFVVKYDPNGVLTRIKQVGTGFGSDDEAHGVAMDTIGNTFVTGRFGDSSNIVTIDFDEIPLTSAGWSDIFVAKLEDIDAVPTYLPIVLKN